MHRPVALVARVAAALLALAAAHAARGDGLTLQAEGSYAHGDVTNIENTPGAARAVRTLSDVWVQRYRLDLDRDLLPAVRLSAGGNLQWNMGTQTTGGATTDIDQKLWTGYARLALGNPILSLSGGYDRVQQGSTVSTSGQVFAAPDVVRETWSAIAAWRPTDLPYLSARASRSHGYDTARTLTDVTTDEAIVSARYEASRHLDLRYSLRYTDADDHLAVIETREVANSGAISWSDRLVDGRLAASLDYSIGTSTTRVVTRGANATFASQQLAVAGLSAIETLPTPEHITLQANPAVVDGDVTAGAGIDLGTGAPQPGNAREIGARFGDPATAIDLVWLWVDRPLPPAVASAFTFEAWRSDDGDTWTPVSLATPPGATQPVQFSPIQNRFEIGISQTQARFVKVVTRPLSPGVTQDFPAIRVTEIQFFVFLSGRTSTRTSGSLTAATRYLLVRGDPSLAYDFTAFVSHSNGLQTKSYSVVNGLSAAKALGPLSVLGGRLDRTDSGGTARPHDSVSRASVTLSYDPLATLGLGATYNAAYAEAVQGTALTNGVALFARADLYTGVAVGANGSYNLGSNTSGQSITNTNATASATVTPNRVIGLTGAYNYSRATASGGGRPDQVDTSARVDGTATFTPFPALFASAGVSRFLEGKTPGTTANVNAGVAPFPGGQLLLRFNYAETLDTAADTSTRTYGPSARWNIRSGSWLELSYATSENRTPALTTLSRTAFADLVVTFR